MSEYQAFINVFTKDVLPLLILMTFISGFVGALCWHLFFDFVDWLAWSLTRKSRARGWLAAQAKKRAAERGGDGAGRACETRDGDTA